MAVIGAGYWGPNLVRNFAASADVHLQWVCDLDLGLARKAAGRYSTIRVTADVEEVLADPEVEAVAIATPAATHLPLGLAAIHAGKHVLIEKPLASTVEDGRKLVEEAEAFGRVLMCDHTYCHTTAVRHIRELSLAGELGELQYVDSVRINLGLVQHDIDVLWDLAPHDLSILDFVLPESCRPTAVGAVGADPFGHGRACVAYLSMPLANGGIAHVHVNWLSPTKIRQFIFGGSRQMLLWDDLNTTARVQLFDKGVDLEEPADGEERRRRLFSYRIGDMRAPALPEKEALGSVVAEFVRAIRTGTAPSTDGHAGLRVLQILEGASESLRSNGTLVPLDLP
ncbi:MAG TPA: Gfo/Idh/MocA family oxidoreductase [Acidimicrobiales bacterium]|nr:Gfo/Idh/MocA family oxidoreductase [Acidimicrobiales bacterium]